MLMSLENWRSMCLMTATMALVDEAISWEEWLYL
jgi:hypothetical protein